MMSWIGNPKSKKSLKETAIGKEPRFLETSAFGNEYKGDGTYPIVGPSPYERKWYAQVTVRNGIVAAVK